MPKTYKFFRKDTKEWENVKPETWTWEAYYEDGTVLKQFDDEGIFHQFQEIDQKKLAVFKMVSPINPNSYTILFDEPGMKLIHFYRNTVLQFATPNQTKVKLYCFGYEKKGQKVVMAITPNNELIVTHDIDIVTVG